MTDLLDDWKIQTSRTERRKRIAYVVSLLLLAASAFGALACLLSRGD